MPDKTYQPGNVVRFESLGASCYGLVIEKLSRLQHLRPDEIQIVNLTTYSVGFINVSSVIEAMPDKFGEFQGSAITKYLT